MLTRKKQPIFPTVHKHYFGEMAMSGHDWIPGECEQPVKLYVCPLVEPTQHCREGPDYSYSPEHAWG